MSRFKVLGVKTQDELNGVIDHLGTETSRAQTHWLLCRALHTESKSHRAEFNQSPEFWRLTQRAHLDSVILRLTRLFDKTKGDPLTLGRFLQTIRLYATAGAPAFGALNAGHIDIAMLDLDLIAVSTDDPVVENLTTIRNKYLAHRDGPLIIDGRLSTIARLEQREIEALLSRAREIVTRYSNLLGRPQVPTALPAVNDYKRLFKLLKLGLGVSRAAGYLPDNIRNLLIP